MHRRKFIINSALYTLMAGISLDSCVPEYDKDLQIQKKNGSFTRNDLIFLLRRATLGFNNSELIHLEKLNLNEVIEKLFNDDPRLSVPLNFEFNEDRCVPLGYCWLKAPYRTDVFYEQYRKKSLRAWLMLFTSENSCSLRQQMMYFWLNFYSVSDVLEHKYEYRHLKYLHDNAWGNFRQITKDVTIDPAMLRFLSGYENTNESPNENYARELLELFTLGRGETAGIGDYTNFTEKDVAEISKLLTGWKDTGWFTEDPEKRIGVEFITEKHDTTSKQLSERFGNAVIHNRGEEEYKSVIDLIFSKKQTAIHFCKRLYRWFCNENITQEAELTVIQPLATVLINNNFEIKPVLKTLFSSQHFFELQINNARIKNPLHYVYNLLHFLPIELPEKVSEKYRFWNDTFETLVRMGLEPLKPPSVAGWKAYYQAPAYSKLWINSASLQNKKKFINKITLKDNTIQTFSVRVNYSKMIQQSNAQCFEELFSHINHIFFAGLLTSEIKSAAGAFFNGERKTFSEKEYFQLMVNGNEKTLNCFTDMLNYLFNLPLLNIE